LLSTAVAWGVAEGAQQAHHVVVVLRRRRAAAGDPIEQVGVGTVEQRLEAVELAAVQPGKGGFAECAENEVGLLYPSMPAAEQEPPAADIRMVVPEAVGSSAEMAHRISPL
jgi:hypothetical protein